MLQLCFVSPLAERAVPNRRGSCFTAGCKSSPQLQGFLFHRWQKEQSPTAGVFVVAPCCVGRSLVRGVPPALPVCLRFCAPVGWPCVPAAACRLRRLHVRRFGASSDLAVRPACGKGPRGFSRGGFSDFMEHRSLWCSGRPRAAHKPFKKGGGTAPYLF